MLGMQGSSKNYKAVVFDFDGTITKKGVHYPSPEMVAVLAEVSQKVPIACCTGRQLESFLWHGLEFFEGVNLENLHLMAENGAVGYFYQNGEFKEFYRSQWPEDFTPRADLMTRMNEVIKEFGSVYFEAHRIVVVLRTKLHNLPYEKRDPDAVAELSGKIYHLACEELARISKDYEQFLHVGDSGIGVVIGPADGDKDFGVEKFGELLRERGVVLSEDLREIMLIGDRPQVGGNDHYFLNGRVGTPFSVGPESEGPFHEEGTRKLLIDAFGMGV